jgi:hypothetical protein
MLFERQRPVHTKREEGREKCTRFWYERPTEGDHSEDRSVDGIRVDLRNTGWGLEWIQLAQDRDRWRAAANTVMNLRVLAPRGWLVG